MDAGNINDALKGVSNFGGIFDANQLEGVKILSLPVMIVVNSEEHWIGLFLDENKLEIMDSIGLVQNQNLNPNLCRFLCAHMRGKDFFATPKLQTDNSVDCGKYVVSFLIFKALTEKSLKEFSSIFTTNFQQNSKNISKIFKTIETLLKQMNNHKT